MRDQRMTTKKKVTKDEKGKRGNLKTKIRTWKRRKRKKVVSKKCKGKKERQFLKNAKKIINKDNEMGKNKN